MDITPYLAAVRTDLEAIAGSDEATLAVGERLARALEPSLQLRLLDALGQAAQELSEQLPSGRIEVRLAGQDVTLSYTGEEPAAAASQEEESGAARVTLRLPESLKVRVEAQADLEGMSTNAWLVRAVTRGLEQRPRRRVGNRIAGMARS
jgi:hypothetical protein